MERRHTGVPRTVLLFATLLLGFAATAWVVSEGRSDELDRRVILALRDMTGPLGPAWIDETARNITSLGSVIVVCLLVGAVAGYLLLRSDRSSAILVLVSVFGGLALNDFLKMIFDRARPALALPFMRVFSSSFPSGHAALSCAAYLSMAALVVRASRTTAMRVYAMAVAIFLVLLVGISRVYLGVHYPSDVLAGWCVGSAWVLICWRAAEEIARRRSGNGRQRR